MSARYQQSTNFRYEVLGMESLVWANSPASTSSDVSDTMIRSCQSHKRLMRLIIISLSYTVHQHNSCNINLWILCVKHVQGGIEMFKGVPCTVSSANSLTCILTPLAKMCDNAVKRKRVNKRNPQFSGLQTSGDFLFFVSSIQSLCS